MRAVQGSQGHPTTRRHTRDLNPRRNPTPCAQCQNRQRSGWRSRENAQGRRARHCLTRRWPWCTRTRTRTPKHTRYQFQSRSNCKAQQGGCARACLCACVRAHARARVCVCVTPKYFNQIHSVRSDTSPLYRSIRAAAISPSAHSQPTPSHTHTHTHTHTQTRRRMSCVSPGGRNGCHGADASTTHKAEGLGHWRGV